jgi:purine catabolism regulator
MLLSATTILFGAAGGVVSQAQQKVRLDSVQTERIWQSYREAGRDGELPRELALADMRLVFREVRLHGRVHWVLALTLPGREHLTEFADVVLTYAQKLLALDLLKSRDSLLLQRKMRSDLLDELLLGIGDPATLADQLAAYELDPGRDLLVAVFEAVDLPQRLAEWAIRGAEQAQEARNELQDAIERFLGESGVPAVTLLRSDAVIALLQPGRGRLSDPRLLGEGSSRAAVGTLGWPHLAIGFSDPFRGLEGVTRAATQAREAVRLARSGRRSGVVLFGELGPSIRFLETQTIEQLTRFYDSTILPLAEHDAAHGDELVGTLRIYLEEHRSVSRAAKRLYVHENTLRYRLKKVESLLHLDLNETESLVDLFLGLRSGVIVQGRTPSDGEGERPAPSPRSRRSPEAG